ncbi:tripartite tricarboxylate transporter TctB family protein [Pusillimonas noertemannii]|uniref:tripartite tricarboxylate transporter TctB family protein n=1 Tax=Pusillimonas noertemannii TaxID=305977 RepID=UPI00047487F9|nr:tripartite tricarboxylate transporter TctB family protein [Pusillimonas noertemannii]
MFTPRVRYDWISVVLSLGLAVLFYASSLSIEPSAYEPLGAASLPKAVAVFLLVMTLAKLATMLKKRDVQAGQPETGLHRSLVMLGLIVLFVLAIDMFKLGFGIAVFFFLIASFLYLVRLRTAGTIIKAVVATAIFSVAVDYVATQVFHFFL